MKFKKVMTSFLALSVSTSVLLTGCGSKNSANNGDKVTISLMDHKIEADSGFKKLAETYEKAHPNVKINIESVGGSTDYGASLKAKMASDPVTIFNYSGLGQLDTWQDQLVDLSDQSWVSKCKPFCLESAKGSDGKVYGMPMLIEGYGFLINRAIFEDAGVDINSMWTFKGQKEGFDKLKSKIESGEMKEQDRKSVV